VDFFSLNVEGNFFMNRPPDDQLSPVAFRGAVLRVDARGVGAAEQHQLRRDPGA
jgi:hypothetical protein